MNDYPTFISLLASPARSGEAADNNGCDPSSFVELAETGGLPLPVGDLCGETVGFSAQHPDLWLYRERTIALLKRYLRISIEVGRLPSLLGRELFRSKVTSYRMSSFEDAVIFVHDVERAIEQLDQFAKEIVATVVFQDYTQDEAAEVLRCARRTICREFPEAIDRISDVFLRGGLLNRLPPRPVENSCQGGESPGFSSSACKQVE
ncbi:MAG TPA: hypothetical protein VIL63_03215 [Terriglobales bacterium]